MEIKISENPNLIDLPKDYQKLTELKVEIVSLLNDQFIKKLINLINRRLNLMSYNILI